MAERIKRADVAQIVRAWKGGGFDALGSGANGLNFQRLAKVYVQNNTGADLRIGQKVYITGRRPSFDTMFREYINDGYMFLGIANANNPYGFCIEPIKQEHIGEVFVNGLCPALLDSETSTHKYAKIDSTGQLVSTDNEREAEFWKVDASSGTNDGKTFAYLIARQKSPEPCGHLVGYTTVPIEGDQEVTSVIVGSGTSAQTYENVTCPLLRENETISDGTTVIISKNMSTGEWQIIEARCQAGN